MKAADRSHLDFFLSQAALISKGLIREEGDDIFLTDKGRELAEQTLNDLGDEKKLLVVLWHIEKADDD